MWYMLIAGYCQLGLVLAFAIVGGILSFVRVHREEKEEQSFLANRSSNKTNAVGA